jgi:hypothetical protein
MLMVGGEKSRCGDPETAENVLVLIENPEPRSESRSF